MKSYIRFTAFAAVVFFFAAVVARAQPPASPVWWTAPVSIFDVGTPTDNWSIANVGQLKHIATQAKAHLDAKLNLTSADWNNAYSNANPFPFTAGTSVDNHAPVNIGQLKFVASGFYRILHTKAPQYDVRGRLQALGVSAAFISGSGPYFPWAATTATGENYSPVTIGQLKIAFSFELPFAPPPQITSQPQSQSIILGGTITFTVAATGAGTVTYQWQKDGVNISGATSATLTLTNLLPTSAGIYTVIVSDSLGWTSSNAAMLRVDSPGRIAAGSYHTVAVKSDGTVWAWGSNSNGQLGIGNTVNQNLPVQASGLTNVVAVTASSHHTVAVKSDGTVWAWGSNSNGQLGIGNTVDQNTPTQVVGLTNVVAVTAGSYNTVALKSDGTVWAWGENGSGQLGIGNTVNQNLPVQVSGLTNVIAVTAASGYQPTWGTSHTVAVKSDGAVWAWGSNYSGQLGIGNTVNQNLPVQVSGLTNVVAVTAGGSHTVAVKIDGTVWVWGQNIYNQLGIGVNTDQWTPVQVGNFNIGGATTPPTVTTQPASVTKGSGQTATFTVVATGSQTLTYQWRKNGTNLANGGNVSGATSSTLSLANVQSADAASYSVVISNSAGSATSDAAVLTVDADTDDDGMDDAWEMLYFGNLSRDGTGDWNLDGLSDRDAFVFGLDPKGSDQSQIPGKYDTFTYDARGWLDRVGLTGSSTQTFILDKEGNIETAN